MSLSSTLYASVCVLFLAIHFELDSAPVITYDFSYCGRFGDQLLNYCKSKWLALKHGLPFMYKPFQYSHVFAMHYLEAKYSNGRYEYQVKGDFPENINREAHIVYVTNYCFTKLSDFFNEALIGKDLLHTQFAQEVKKQFQVHTPLHLIQPPQDAISVAVHIRKGGRFDLPLLSRQIFSNHEQEIMYQVQDAYDHFDHIRTLDSDWIGSKNISGHGSYSDLNYPYKFPPTQFYIDQIKKIAELFKDQMIYVFIFTDDLNPGHLTDTIERACANNRITFDCHAKQDYEATVIEDFCSMLNFDCLIRSASNFSWAIHLIGNHNIVLYPKGAIWHDNTLIINNVGMVYKYAHT